MFKFLLKKYEKQIYELADCAVKEAEIFFGKWQRQIDFSICRGKKFFINVKLWRKNVKLLHI